MAIQTSKKGGIFNEINITPLTDIFLVLLIIMMVIAPMFQSLDKNINIPKLNNGAAVQDDKVIVSITKNSEFFVNKDAIDVSELNQTLNSLIDKTKEKTVVVRADESIKSAEVMKVMRAAQAAGYEKLTVAGEPLSQQQQNELLNKSNS